jgi:lincosamide nucleotidyltransferase A/C/D/E
VWVDGGWCVDALIGHQTRPHSDLDIAIEAQYTETCVDCLLRAEFSIVVDHDSKPWNFVMAHKDGRSVDFHVFVLDEIGNGIYGPPENNDTYPAQTLSGCGVLNGNAVNCLSPEGLIRFRDEYPCPPRERDFQDVLRICHHFDLPVPAKYSNITV